MTPKYCMACGGKLPAGGRFCPSCGVAFGKSAPEVKPAKAHRTRFDSDASDDDPDGEDVSEVPELDKLSLNKENDGGAFEHIDYKTSKFSFQDLLPK